MSYKTKKEKKNRAKKSLKQLNNKKTTYEPILKKKSVKDSILDSFIDSIIDSI